MLHIDVVAAASGLEVQVSGEWDWTGPGEDAIGRLGRALPDSGARDVTFDLAGLEHLSCAGLRSLLRAVSTLEERGVTVRTRVPHGSPLRVIEICGVAARLRVTA